MRVVLCLILALAASSAGARWEPAGRPVEGALTAVAFPSPDAVWVGGAGGALFRSVTNGAEWTPQSLPFAESVTSLSFFGTQAGFAARAHHDGARTVNGGATWTPMTIVTDDLGLGAPGWVGPLDATGPSSAWTIARWGDYTTLLRTVDGETWLSVRYTDHSYYSPNSVYSLAFVDDLTGWLAGSRINEGGVFEPVLLRTTNGGVTWRVFTAPESALNAATEPRWTMLLSAVSATEVLLHVYDPARSLGVLFRLKETAPDVWTWSARDLPFAASAMSFIDAENGWLVGPGTLQTADGGASFRALPHPDGGLFTDAAFVDADRGWAVDETGRAWRWERDRPGDVAPDGRVDLLDALAAARIAAEGGAPDAITLGLADVAPAAGDGTVTAADAAAILRLAAGM